MIRAIETHDHKELATWYGERGLAHPDLSLLPPEGLIQPGTAAGYLVKTDSGVAFLEHFISNPNSLKSYRKASLYLISEKLIESAKAQNFKQIYALTQSPEIEKLTKMFNFQPVNGYNMFVLRSQ